MCYEKLEVGRRESTFGEGGGAGTDWGASKKEVLDLRTKQWEGNF